MATERSSKWWHRARSILPRRAWVLLPRGSRGRRPLRLRFGAQLGLFVLLGVAVLLASAGLLLHGFGGALHLGHLRASEQLDIVKISLSVVAGVGGVIALTVAYRKQQLGEAAHGREEVKLFTERFGACVAQLGDDSPAVRLGGAYALAHLADDWETGRQTCIDVLCSQLRMPYPTDQPDDPDAHAAFLSQREVRHTIWQLIGDHLRPGITQHSWDRHNFNFTSAVIDGADLQGIFITAGTINFTRAKFSSGEIHFGGAKFTGGEINFAYAKFTGATVDFADAAFSGAKVNFVDTQFSGGKINFIRAKFASGEIHFVGAEFLSGEADFRDCEFLNSEVKFFDAKFSGGKITFFGAEFTGGEINFVYTKFTGGEANFVYAKFRGAKVDFGNAEFSGGKVSFNLVRFSGGKVDFVYAKFSGSNVNFVHAQFTGSEVSFLYSEFSGGDVKFIGAKFAKGEVDFVYSEFSGANVNFHQARFSGSKVDFSNATFSGGRVNISSPKEHGVPPLFDAWSVQPKELLLP